jgi:hypothetical protein
MKQASKAWRAASGTWLFWMCLGMPLLNQTAKQTVGLPQNQPVIKPCQFSHGKRTDHAQDLTLR